MPYEKRTKGKLSTPGPFLAEITNHLDSTYMGGIEVALIKGIPNSVYQQEQTFVVRYLNPFYGVTSIRYEGNDPKEFNDVQKSYGMWMVPPDVGTIVMVIFIDGDPNQGYWIGCVQDEYQNHMVPGIAASRQTHMSQEQREKYGTDYLPVAEFHKGSQLSTNPNIATIAKPIHPFADRLLAQGLLFDTIRGVTSSSARREIPSSVFGISTPGPVDERPGAKRGRIGYTSERQIPVSRLGGTTFVMDDGDINGQNELVRIRTRTGHQILLHNSQDLIYIANSKGTAWIEMTSSGKLDIYAQDSVSIHTESDFNFRADRDINLESGRNFNIKVSGSMTANVKENYNLMVDEAGKLSFGSSYDQTVSDNYTLSVGANAHTGAGGNVSLKSSGSSYFTTAGSTNIASSGQHYETATKINMNGPTAGSAQSVTAAIPPVIPLFSLPNRNKDAGWGGGNQYKAGSITSIMQRVPTHEPWDQHENINAQQFSSENTDAVTGATSAARSGAVPSANQPLPPPNSDQPAEWSKDESFIKKVKEISSSIGCNYIDLLACMAFETGRKFDPALRNFIGATGLIQFIPSTAQGLGTTTDYLASLTRTQQCDWVLKYFKAGPVKTISSPSLEDMYMAILWPKAVGQDNNYVLFNSGTKQYSQNSGLDIGSKGYITKADAASKVRSQIPYVTQQLANATLK
jgi:hypothetical protein